MTSPLSTDPLSTPLTSPLPSTRQAGSKELGNWGSMDPQFAHADLISACEQLGLGETLASLLASSNNSTVAAAASLLGAMAQ